MRRTAPLIVGGGPAGATAALALARAGERPLLLERSAESQDALCGGFLSWRTRATLAGLGVDPGGAAVGRLRIVAGERVAEATLPAPAIGLSRRTLDLALRRAAQAAGAAIETGVAARALEEGSVRLADGAAVEADALFLAVGKHDLRGAARPHDAADATLGLRVHLDGPLPALDNHIELHLFDRGYAGIVRQEDGRANLCLAVGKSRLTEAGGTPDALLAALAAESPRLGERLARRVGGADAVAAVPYGWRALATAPGLFRLGDQAAVIPSLAGEGIHIALASALSATAAWRRGGMASASAWQSDFATRARRPLAIAGLLWRLAERPSTAALLALAARAPGLAALAAKVTRLDSR